MMRHSAWLPGLPLATACARLDAMRFAMREDEAVGH